MKKNHTECIFCHCDRDYKPFAWQRLTEKLSRQTKTETAESDKKVFQSLSLVMVYFSST